MDAIVQEERGVRAPISRGAGVALLGVALLATLIELLDRATLVDPIPLPLTFASAAIGFAGGIWLALGMRFPSYIGGFRRALGRITMPIFGAIVATFFVRVAVERVAFVGLSPTETLVEAHVESAGQERNGGQFASVSFGPGTRSVNVEISPELFDQLLPFRASRQDCIMLSVQEGRFGLRRTMLPRRWFDKPISEDHYRKTCQT